MSAPVSNGSGPMVGVNLGSLTDPATDTGLTNALGNAAQKMAEKGAMAQGPDAKDYAAAALAYVQALMAIVAPKVAQPPPSGSPHGPGPGAQKPSQKPAGPA